MPEFGIEMLLNVLRQGRIQTLAQIVNTALVEQPERRSDCIAAVNAEIVPDLGKSGAKALGRDLTRQIDAIMEKVEPPRDAAAIGKALAKNAVVQLGHVSQLLLVYPAQQEAVLQARREENEIALAAAIGKRDAAAEAIKQALYDIGKAIGGVIP